MNLPKTAINVIEDRKDAVEKEIQELRNKLDQIIQNQQQLQQMRIQTEAQITGKLGALHELKGLIQNGKEE